MRSGPVSYSTKSVVRDELRMSLRAKVSGRNWFAMPSARGLNEPLMRRLAGLPSASCRRKRGFVGLAEKTGPLCAAARLGIVAASRQAGSRNRFKTSSSS